MITKTNAVKKSIRKYERIIKALKKNTFDYPLDKCGFCQFFNDCGGCTECPLYPDICFRKRDPYTLYWQISGLIVKGEYTEAIPLAEQMLSEIRARGEKWIKGGLK